MVSKTILQLLGAMLIAGCASVASAQTAALGGTASTAAPAKAATAAPLAENTEREVAAYCGYVQAVGDSNSALLFSPGLFATLGNAPTTALDDGSNVATSRLRLQLGLRFSPTKAYRGLVTQDLAKAECQRYAAEARTPAAVPISISERRALLSKIEVLEAAVARGHELREELMRQLATSLATVDEYQSLTLLVNGLEQSLAEASARLALLPQEPPRPSAAQLAARVVREDEVQAAEARLRRSQALEVEVRVGYQRTFGLNQKLPLFALGIVEFAPGWLWQGPADVRAHAAHRKWQEARAARSQLRLTPEQRAQLQQGLEVTRARAHRLAATLADLEGRRAAVERVPNAQARRQAAVMGLQLTPLVAEQAYLKAYAAAIEQVLAEPSG